MQEIHQRSKTIRLERSAVANAFVVAIKENHPLPFSVWLDGLLAYLENQRPPACGIKVDMKNIECVESVLGSLKKRVPSTQTNAEW